MEKSYNTFFQFQVTDDYKLQGCYIPQLTIPNGQGYGFIQNCSSSMDLGNVKHSCQIHYFCYDGFEMKGNPTITCNNGEWALGDKGGPKCKTTYCLNIFAILYR